MLLERFPPKGTASKGKWKRLLDHLHPTPEFKEQFHRVPTDPEQCYGFTAADALEKIEQLEQQEGHQLSFREAARHPNWIAMRQHQKRHGGNPGHHRGLKQKSTGTATVSEPPVRVIALELQKDLEENSVLAEQILGTPILSPRRKIWWEASSRFESSTKNSWKACHRRT